MQNDEPGIPAWLLCEDILNKIKTELITEAMDTLQEAINSKAIEISGSLVTLPDKPSETEMNMFIINKLLDEKDKIIEQYSGYLADESADTDPKKVEQKERLRKFLFAVEQISKLMEYSHLFDPWMTDVGMQITIKDPSEIIKITMHGNEARMEVLKYVLNSKKIEKEEILSENERKILANSMEKG